MRRRKLGSARSSKKTRLRHFGQRADEWTPVQAEKLKQLVRDREFLKVEKQTKTRWICVCRVDGFLVWFIYSSYQKVPVTVLPPDSQRIQDAIEDNPDLPKWVRDYQIDSTGSDTQTQIKD